MSTGNKELAKRLFVGTGPESPQRKADRPPIFELFHGDCGAPETLWYALRLHRPGRDEPSHGDLWRTPAKPLPPPASYRAIDRRRVPASADSELIKRIDLHLARACAWWSTPPDTAEMEAAVASHGKGPDAGVIEAWVGEGHPELWLAAWRAWLYSLEDLVASAVRTRTDHRLFRHLFGTFGQRPAGTEPGRD